MPEYLEIRRHRSTQIVHLGPLGTVPKVLTFCVIVAFVSLYSLQPKMPENQESFWLFHIRLILDPLGLSVTRVALKFRY